MSGSVLTVSSSKLFHPITPDTAPDMFAQMEATQAKIDPRKMEADLTPTRLRNVPMELQREALAVVDKICEETKQESVTRRLARLTARISEVTERHIFQKRGALHEKTLAARANVEEQKDWKNYQAWAQCAGGFGTAFLAFGGAMVGGKVGPILEVLSRLTQPAAESLSRWMEGEQVPLSHEQQLFLSSVSADRQTIEGLKNLPDSLRQLIQRLLDLESQAYRAVAQG